jgi:predicted O-methyltransferase YrrM
MRPGGLITLDNMPSSGAIARPARGPDTAALQALYAKFRNDVR